MPSPSTSLATLRPDLRDSFEEFDLEADRLGFVGLRVFPVIDVAKQTGVFGRIPIEELLRNRETRRAPGAVYTRGGWKFEDHAFFCREHGTTEVVDDRESEMYAEYFDAELVSAEVARDAVLRGFERRIADSVFNTTVWTGAALTTAVGTDWADAAGAEPVTDVENAVVKVWEGTGLWPNAIVLSRLTFRRLRNCDQVIERIASQGAGNPTKASDITAQMLGAVFDLPHVIVAGGAKNTADEGLPAEIDSIWSPDMAMVCRVATTKSVKEPCIGRTFHWSADGSSIGGTIETYRFEDARGEIVRVRMDTDENRLYPGLGHLLTGLAP